jgi:hypothetical protein
MMGMLETGDRSPMVKTAALNPSMQSQRQGPDFTGTSDDAVRPPYASQRPAPCRSGCVCEHTKNT